MGAGPTADIGASAAGEGYQVSVEWGDQKAKTHARMIRGAREAADRLAHVFYDVRNDQGSD
jgi:hypothetical protein